MISVCRSALGSVTNKGLSKPPLGAPWGAPLSQERRFDKEDRHSPGPLLATRTPLCSAPNIANTRQRRILVLDLR